MRLRPPLQPEAFTRAELMAVLAISTLLLVVALPGLAHNKPRSQRSTCVNNLRQIGAGYLVWASDHGDRFPHTISPIGASGEFTGGTKTKSLAWEQFAAISNELATARILICPSDAGRTPTNLAVNLKRNENVSYFFGTHADLTQPDSFVAGDRDVQGGSSGLCPVAGTINVTYINSATIQSVQWSKTNHVDGGNTVQAHGGVKMLSTEQLRAAIKVPLLPDGIPFNGHFLKPYLPGEPTF
jgi:competence protein ComGC